MILEKIMDSVLRRYSIANPEEQEHGHALVKRLHELFDQTHQRKTTFSVEAGADPGQSLRSRHDVDPSWRSR